MLVTIGPLRVDYKINRIDELMPWRVADKLHAPASPPTPLPDCASSDHHHASRRSAWTNGPGAPLTVHPHLLVTNLKYLRVIVCGRAASVRKRPRWRSASAL